MKKLLLFIVIFFFLGIIAAVVLPFVVDLNRFKPQIQAKIQEAVGVEVDFREVRLSILPRIGAVIKDLKIENLEGFSEESTVTVKTISCAINLLPLLRREVEVKRLFVEEPRIFFVEEDAGGGGEASFGEKASFGKGGSLPALLSLSVSQIDIIDGEIVYRGSKLAFVRKESLVLKDIDMTIRDFSLDSPFYIYLSTYIDEEPYNHLVAEGKIGPVGYGKIGGIDMDIELRNLQVGKWSYLFGDIKSSDIKFGGKLDIESSISGVLDNLDIEAVVNMDRVEIEKQGVFKKDVYNKLGLNLKLRLREDELFFEEVRLNSDILDAVFKGKIRDFAKGNSYIDLEMKGKLRLDDMREVIEGFSGVDLKGVFNIEGSLRGRLSEPYAQGNLTGDLEIYRGDIRRFNASDIQLDFAYRERKVDLKRVEFEVYKGRFKGKGVCEASLFKAEFGITGVDMNMLFSEAAGKEDKIFGNLSAGAEISGILAEEHKETLESLNGSGNINVEDAKFMNLNLLKKVLTAAELFGMEMPTERWTEIDSMGVSFDIAQRRLHTEDIAVHSKYMELTGTGDIGFDNSLDLQMDAVFSKRVSEKLSSSVVSEYLLNEEGRLVIPLLIKGTFPNPKFRLDIVRKTQQVIETHTQDLIQEGLESIFGRIKKELPKEESAQSQEAGAAQESTAPTVEETVEELINIFFGK